MLAQFLMEHKNGYHPPPLHKQQQQLSAHGKKQWAEAEGSVLRAVVDIERKFQSLFYSFSYLVCWGGVVRWCLKLCHPVFFFSFLYLSLLFKGLKQKYKVTLIYDLLLSHIKVIFEHLSMYTITNLKHKSMIN